MITCSRTTLTRSPDRTRAFTIVELLVVVSIIALLLGILLPAIGKARDAARVSASEANLRNLATAMATYAASWNDRQLTFCDDNLQRYGRLGDAFTNYWAEHGGGDYAQHPPVGLGWGRLSPEGPTQWFAYRTGGSCANGSLTIPINFSVPGCANPELVSFGSFRLLNAEQFNQYVSGRFYDPVFYAPKDVVVRETVGECFQSPDSYCTFTEASSEVGQIPVWSSYCLSPAAMYSPQVLARNDPNDPGANGFVDPWTLPGAFRSPSLSQARYANLKTQILEHHWLQDPLLDCNPCFESGTYVGGCEPLYFNHGAESSPVTLFYDGHVEQVGVTEAIRADGRMRAQVDNAWGLWSRDVTGWESGYLMDCAYDDEGRDGELETSFHILTTDGILGRDVLPNN